MRRLCRRGPPPGAAACWGRARLVRALAGGALGASCPRRGARGAGGVGAPPSAARSCVCVPRRPRPRNPPPVAPVVVVGAAVVPPLAAFGVARAVGPRCVGGGRAAAGPPPRPAPGPALGGPPALPRVAAVPLLLVGCAPRGGAAGGPRPPRVGGACGFGFSAAARGSGCFAACGPRGRDPPPPAAAIPARIRAPALAQCAPFGGLSVLCLSASLLLG